MRNDTTRNHRRLVVACLMTGAALSVPARALADPANPKPVNTRQSCTSTPVYELIALTAPTEYRTTSTQTSSGYDPAGTAPSCGPVTRAQPLTCIDATGVPTRDGEACAGAPSQAYSTRNLTTVYRGSGALNYYTTQASRIGVDGAPVATAIRIRNARDGECIQLSEVEAFAGTVNVALASNGATATSSAPYDGSANASRAIDGARPAAYPNIFHSQCRGGDYVLVTFAKAVKVTSVAAWGRTDYQAGRDNFVYELLNGSEVVSSGGLDANNSSYTASAATIGGCEASPSYEWRSVQGSAAGICGTAMVDNQISCVNRTTSVTVDPSLCNAGQRPPSQTQVTGTEGCNHQYAASAWSAIPASCGDVVQTRTVTCTDASGATVADAACANYLTPPADRLAAGIPASEYWSRGPYAWEGAPGDAITIWRMPDLCAGEPADVRNQCEVRYLGKAGTSQSYLRPRETRTVNDQRACTAPPPAKGTWNTPTYTPDRANVCGPNTRTGRVFCRDSTGAEVPDDRCEASTRPASTQSFEDTSGCSGSTQTNVVPSVKEIQVGWCNYTSSGGGRHACGDYTVYRPGPAAPVPGDLCTGNLIAGGIRDYAPEPYQSIGGSNWVTPPVLRSVPGAQCVIHWKMGYSDGGSRATWSSAYYDGPATGRTGGTFLGRKP